MALFRFHRGSLQESLMTTIVVKSKQQLFDYITQDFDRLGIDYEPDQMVIERYPAEACGSNFDERIGWFTHIVTLSGEVEGFLSEALHD